MLVLDSTSKSVTAVLSASPTTNPDFVATYADATSDAFTEAANDGALNGTTAVTLVAAPSSGVRRVVKEIIIYNRNTSSVTLTVRYVNDTNTRVLWSGTLQPAETWTLSRHVLSPYNWQHIASSAPTNDDDSTKGFVIGSRWIDITNGQVYICVDATQGAAVWRNLSSALSASDGDPAKAAYCDTEGRLLTPNRPAFFAYRTEVTSNITGDGTAAEVPFNATRFNVGSAFSNNVFTAPCDGLYQFGASIRLGGIISSHVRASLTFLVNSFIVSGKSLHPFNVRDALGGAQVLQLNCGLLYSLSSNDTVKLQITVWGSSSKDVFVMGQTSADVTYFYGHLVG